MRVPRHMLHCRGCGRVYYANASDVATGGDLRCDCGVPLRHVIPRREDGSEQQQNEAAAPLPVELLPEAPEGQVDAPPPDPDLDPSNVGEYHLAGDSAGEARPVLAALAPEQPGRVLPYRPVVQEVVDASLYFPDKLTDLYAPAGLLLLGTAAGVAELIHLYGDVWQAVSFGTAYLVVKLLMLLMTIPLLIRIAGVSFGTLPSAALKLTAIAILPETVGVAVALFGGCAGAALAIPVSFVASWVMFARLFDLDVVESRLCAAVYWGVGLAFGFAWASLLWWLLDVLW